MKSRRVGSAGSGAGTNQAAPTGNVIVVPDDADSLTLEFRTTAIGATPTVTYQWQASDDDQTVTEANSDWYPIFATPAGAAADANAGGTVTTVANADFFLNLKARPVKKLRLIVSANTNVTWDSEVRALTDGE